MAVRSNVLLFDCSNVPLFVQTFETVEKVTLDARKIGFTSINFDVIYGLSLHKKTSVMDTIHKITLLKPDRIAFYSYAHIPWIKPGNGNSQKRI